MTDPDGGGESPLDPDSTLAPAPTSSAFAAAFGGVAGTIGPYRLLQQLGEGGMGVVWLAEQLQPIRRDVALKVIKPGMDSRQVIARFESERQALALMDHPHIARVFDAGTTATGLPYFVMERVDGVPITRYCNTRRLTVRERIELFIPVCQAIQHAHQKGIIHRDVKPSNILIKQQENRAVPKVIDFGLAKALSEESSDATMMTRVGTVVGTLSYMSPEQAELGRQDVDTRSDVYSLGAVLYELLTGATPLDHERLARASYVDALQHVREEEPPSPSVRLRRSGELKQTAAERRSDPVRLHHLLEHELDWIAMKALDKDRTRRYETVNALARDLERYLAGDPVEAAPPSAAYRMRKFVRRHRLGLSTAAGFAALLLAAVVVSSWMAVRASRAEQEARAVNAFLEDDLLARASASNQASPDIKPDPDLKVRTALDRAATRIEGKFSSQPLVESSIRYTIGDTYKDLGLYPEAQKQLESALTIRRRVIGEAHPDTLQAMDALGNLYWLQGKYAEAEPLTTRLLERRRRVLGEAHSATIDTMVLLAMVYRGQGKYALAEPLLIKAVEAGRHALGEENQIVVKASADLALVYSDQGKQAQAEPLLIKVLETWRRVGGEEHPETLQCMNNLALSFARQGKYAQAEPLFSRVLEVRRHVLGQEHQETLRSLHNLGALYNLQGRYAQAGPLFASALELRARVLGEEHPDTLRSMDALAGLYRNQGKDAQAEKLYVRVVDLRLRVLGAEHRDTIASLASLGEIRLRQQEYVAAEPVLRDALKRYEETASDSWARYECQAMLGASMAGQKKYMEAEPLLIGGYSGMIEHRATMPSGSRSVEKAGQRILQFYQGWGKPEKVAEWRERLPKDTPTRP